MSPQTPRRGHVTTRSHEPVRTALPGGARCALPGRAQGADGQAASSPAPLLPGVRLEFLRNCQASRSDWRSQ